MFSVRADRGDGLDLRSIRYGDEDVASRLYFAVRDTRWRTVPLTVVHRRSETTPTGFRLDVDAVTGWESHPLEVSLRYEADGAELRAEFTAVARGAFTYGRIGFCVLFPVDGYRGRPATSWQDGAATRFDFPTDIITCEHTDPAAERFHRPFDRLATGPRVSYTFEGERFEFEDQRNWTDASYKAYSCQPAGGPPLSTVDGSRFAQRIRIAVEPGTTVARGPIDRQIRLGGRIGTVPPIGLYSGRISARSYRPAGGFYELNAAGAAGAAAYDSVELGVNGAVHAADDDSVQETTALHGVLVAQARALHPHLPVRLAPVSFLDVAGDWRDAAGQFVPAPPDGVPPPRWYTGFAATWVVASAARALPAGPAEVRYLDAALPADTPAARTVARLGALRGRHLLEVTAPAPLAVLAVDGGTGEVTLAVANPGPDRVVFRLPDGREAALDGFTSAWYDLPHGAAGP